MATVSPQAVGGVAGVDLTMSSASGGGDVLVLDPNPNVTLTLLVITAGTGTTPTLVTPALPNTLAVADNAPVIGTNKVHPIPLPYALYADANGQCAVSWSATTSVTFAVVRT